jgi:hypothetical protein
MQMLVFYFLSLGKVITEFCAKDTNVAGVIVFASLLLMALMTPSQSKRTDRFVRFLYKRVPLFSSYGQALFVVKSDHGFLRVHFSFLIGVHHQNFGSFSLPFF